jgi:Helix-turn-helix domain
VRPASLTADEVAELYRVSRDALYESVRRGDCPVEPLRVGRRLVWPTALVERSLGMNSDS